MKDYLWVGETRMVPNVGAPKPGDTITLNEDLGDSLVAQGLCTEVSPSEPTTTIEED